MQLRPYQQECIDRLLAKFREYSRVLAVLPTGAGKTIILAALAHRMQPLRSLVIAHREELITQAVNKIRAATGLCAEIEKAEDRASHEAPVVVASVQTLAQEQRRGRWPKDHFGLVVVDESHHVLADSYQSLLAHFHDHAKVLGVTATPDRGDKRSLGEYFEEIGFEIGLHDLIKQGYLSRIVVKTVPLQIDLGGVKTVAGDFNDADLGDAIEPYLRQIIGEMKAAIGTRKTLVFLPLVRTSRRFVELCREAGLTAEHIDGQSTDRKEILDRYAAGEFQVLANSLLLTEGFDEPSVACVVCLRPTKIRAMYCLDEETEVLTASGWAKDVDVGDPVAAFDPSTGAIRFVPVRAKVRRQLEPDEYFVSIKGAAADIRVTNRHRMLYDNKRRLGWKFETADYLAGLSCGAYLPVSGRATFPGAPLSDDEIRFIGWVMTHGTIHRRNRAILISQAEHQPWIDQIRTAVSGSGLKYGEYRFWRKTQFHQNSRNVVFTVSHGMPRGRDRHLRGWAHLEKWISKDFSEELLWTLDERQFEILLETINLGDGNKHCPKDWTRHTYQIGKDNRVFMERLQIACVLRGHEANLSVFTKNRKNPFYMLHIRKNDRICLGSTHDSRPQWRREPHTDESCWCVENELGTLVTRRRGKVVIVGNCQIIGRGTRLHPSKENLLVLDFLWHTERHALVRPAHLVAASTAEADSMTEILEKAAREFGSFGSGDEESMEQDLLGLMEDAKEQREAKLARELAQNARRRSQMVDPVEFALSLHAMDLAEWEPTMHWHEEPPTPKQLSILTNLGFEPKAIRSKGYASQLLDRIFTRRELKLATPKQVMWLRRTGHPSPETATMEEAKAYLSEQFAR
jgi:superfamily II DNA or RNA helicase